MKRLTGLLIASDVGPLLAITAAGCLLAVVVTGCMHGGTGNGPAASTESAPVKPEARYRVVVPEADLFHNSVLQPSGADEKIKQDTRVTLVKRYGGYAQITTGSSTGYVAMSDIAPLSASDIAAEEAATRAQQAPPNALAPLTPGPGGTYSIPPEATRETVLPVPDASPAAKPTPNEMFRY